MQKTPSSLFAFVIRLCFRQIVSAFSSAGRKEACLFLHKSLFPFVFPEKASFVQREARKGFPQQRKP